MKVGFSIVLACLTPGIACVAQRVNLTVPKIVEAGAAFSIQCGGNGRGTLYIVGPVQVIKRDVELGKETAFAAGTLYNAGHYSVWLESKESRGTASIDVVPEAKPSNLTFIAKPSRLQVALQGGITGTAYVFDSYGNLITKPLEISFELSDPAAATQRRIVETRNGAAWTEMDSTQHEGKDEFVVRTGDVSNKRVIFQVPSEPCSLRMSATPLGNKIQLMTDPVRDCSGNAVPDGTVVTFTEIDKESKSTVDVPLKKGIATVEMPLHRGAMISVASGVVLGNQIRWE